MKTVRGMVVEDGRSFTLDMAKHATVADVKQAIKETMGYQFPADRMTLHLTKQGNGEWLKFTDADAKQLQLGEVPDRVNAILTDSTEMHSSLSIGDSAFAFPDAGEAGGEDLHLVAKIPEIAATAAATKRRKVYTAEDLATVHPRVQVNVWKSVVRISINLSTKVIASSTALVVDRSPTHLYLLTNLGLWVDQRLAGDLSGDFKKEIAHFLHLHPLSAKDEKRDDHSRPSAADKPRIVIEKLNPEDNEMEVIHEFDLESDVCWKSSADLDFAVIKVEMPGDDRLAACEMASFGVVPTMKVHAYLFRNIPYQFGPPYAIIPAEVTGVFGNEINLSAHGLPDGAIVCTNDGLAIGYLGGASIMKYPSCGFRLEGTLVKVESKCMDP